MLRELRAARKLTLAAVARHAGCTPALLSYVESGQRHLHIWLAEQLDRIYETGGLIAALVPVTGTPREDRASGVPHSDLFVVQLPQGGAPVVLSRRELLVALGTGVASERLLGSFEQKLDGMRFDGDLLRYFEDAFNGFQEAARMLPPQKLMDGMLGNVAILDGLRRRAPKHDTHRYGILQARYAESLSWLNEEAGNLSGAMWWIDRATQWAQAANWPVMTEYSFVRRSMMVISFSGNGHRAMDQAHHVLNMPNATPRMRGLATKQLAFAYALVGDRDSSHQALDAAMNLLGQPAQENDSLLGQRSVVGDDLFAIFRSTCDIYLGYGEQVIPVLLPRLASLSKSSARTATITRAKLARAYANSGQPGEACHIVWDTLDAIDRIGSLSAHSELRRTVAVLGQWSGRSDVQDVARRMASTTSLTRDT